MNFQEPQDEQQHSVDSQLAMLHLNTTTGIHHHNSTTEQQCHSCDSLKNEQQQQQPHFSPEKTTLLPPISTTKTKKRYSNTRFSSSLEEPFPKRTATVTLLPTISTTSNHNDHLQGFIKLPLENHHNLESQAFLKPKLFENSTTPSPAKPPLPPPLYRTFSDPTGSCSYKRKSPTPPPPHHTLARTTSWSPNGESPTTMKSPNQCALTRTASWSPNVESPTTMVCF
ncbi:uncharacterized protein LOC132639892 [Lycium barbarum]|uniref:uncharacterized protein LOC132639892 n=1 Tax=Lycium barbarum TaxID=112863 RepID=UPI00293E085B|nr:uncharacterized protein LOC132639892 [Lycium barbarum]